MPRYLLADRINAAKRFGLKVEVVPGAQTRGSDAYNPGCYVGHHTAGAKTGDRPSLSLVVNGRSDLAGPLANDFMPRSGGLVIVACGRSNNAGLGGFRGIVGNSGTIGCEAEDDGDGIWTPEQWRDYPRVVASGLYLMHRDQTWYCSHRTWALTPPSKPGRKIDPTGIMDPWMAAWVSVLFRNPNAVPRQGMPTAADLTSTGDEDVPLTPAEWTKLTNIVRDVSLRTALAVQTGKPNNVVDAKTAAGLAGTSSIKLYELTAYGDSRLEVDKPEPHANSIQRTRFELLQQSATLSAMLEVLKQLAEAQGQPIDMDAVRETVKTTVESGLAQLDLRITSSPAGEPLDPTPSA
jgi:hypothetical protein